MLILTRRTGEQIMIGNDIVVTICGINGNQIRVGITAPADVPVHRKEVAERIEAEKRDAAGQHQGVVAIRKPAAAR